MKRSDSKHKASRPSITSRYRDAVRCSNEIKKELNAFDLQLSEIRQYSNNIEKTHFTRNDAERHHQNTIDRALSRHRYRNQLIGAQLSSQDIADDNTGSREDHEPDGMVSCNNHSAANKRLRIRKALSSSPRKSESGAPISKTVLYPALLQYIGRKMVKSSNNTERTNHFERKTSSQPTSQHPPCQEPNLLERNVTHRAQRTQSNVTEELRWRKVLVEQAMMNDVRNGGNNIERPLRRSRSSTSALMRTKPRTMTHSQLVEQSVARKINQIRASPTYKQLEVRSSTDRNAHSKALLNSSLNTGLGEQLTEDYAAQPLIESRRKESRNFPSNSATPTLSSQIPRFLSVKEFNNLVEHKVVGSDGQQSDSVDRSSSNAATVESLPKQLISETIQTSLHDNISAIDVGVQTKADYESTEEGIATESNAVSTVNSSLSAVSKSRNRTQTSRTSSKTFKERDTRSSSAQSKSDQVETSITDQSKSDQVETSITDQSKSDQVETSITDQSKSDQVETSITDQSKSDQVETSITDQSKSDQVETSITDQSKSDQVETSITDQSKSDQVETSITDQSKSDQVETSITDQSKSDQVETSITDQSKSDQVETSITDQSKSDRTESSMTDQSKAFDHSSTITNSSQSKQISKNNSVNSSLHSSTRSFTRSDFNAHKSPGSSSRTSANAVNAVNVHRNASRKRSANSSALKNKFEKRSDACGRSNGNFECVSHSSKMNGPVLDSESNTINEKATRKRLLSDCNSFHFDEFSQPNIQTNSSNTPQTFLSSVHNIQTQELAHSRYPTSVTMHRSDSLSKKVKQSLNTLDHLTDTIERATRLLDASFGDRMSISSYEQMPLNNSIDNLKSSYHHYAVTPLLRTVVQPQSSDPNLPLDERVNQLNEHRRDTTKILEFTDEAQNFGNNLVTQESDAQSDVGRNSKLDAINLPSMIVDVNEDLSSKFDCSTLNSVSPIREYPSSLIETRPPPIQMSSSIPRSMQGKENDSFEDNVATASYLHRVSCGKDESRKERNDPKMESMSNRQVMESNFKEPTERPQNRDEIVKMTMQALNQYLEDVCVYFYWRKKELLNLNELDQWHEMNEKQKSVENDIADMKRIYEESKHIAKPYEEYFRYHMHEIARLHLLSIQIREELLSTGVSNRAEKKKLNDMKRRAEKALRLSAPVELSDVVEKRHTDEERLRPEKCSRFALVTASEDERSLRNNCIEDSAQSVANNSFGNRRPMRLIASTIADGSMGMNENRVTTLRGELKQKREEANVLRENFDRKLHSDGGCGVNSEHGEQGFLTSAENSVLEQIKAHESYIKQTSDHIAYLDQLQIDQTSIDSHSNLLVQSLPSPSSQYDATKSTSVTTSIETPTSALLSDVNEVIKGRSQSCDDDSMNDVMLTSQSSTLVPESDYASEIEHRKTSFEEHPKSEGAIHHQQDVDATPMKSPHSSVHVQEPINEMRMSPGEISSAAFRPDVVKMNQHEHMVDANLSVDGTSDESCDISEYNLSQLDETVNTRSVMESFEKLHISAHNDAQKEESHIEHVNSVGLDEAAAFSEGTSKPSQIFHDQASIDQELSPNDHSSPFVVKGSDMQSVKNESHEDNNYSPELSTKMESFVPRLNLDELDTKDLPPEQLRFEQEEGEPVIADNEEQERSEQDEKRTSEEISAHSESKIIEKETTHPDALAPSSKNLPERETSPVDESETDDKSLVLHLPDKDQLVETNNGCKEILEEVPSAVEEYDATVCSDEVEDERVVENNASKVDSNAQSETSEDADSECFFTDTASSHQVSLGSSQDFASMKPQDILNEDDISAGETLIADAPAEVVDSECIDDQSTQKNVLSSVSKSEENLNDGCDVFVDAREFNDAEAQILDRTPEMLAEDINSSVLNNTSQRLSFGRERIKSDDESESLSTKRSKPRRFALTVSPLNVASPRSPLATRFATVMPSPSRNRSPRSLNSTPRSPRVTSARVVSPLGKLLLDQSLNDSLLTMLTAMNEKKRSVAEEEFENSVSFQEQNSAENVLSEISRTDQERIGPQSVLEKSWMNDSAKYDLNNIPVPPDLLDFTPLDLSGVYSNNESNKLSDMDSIHRVTEEKQRLVGIPDLTCDTPVPKKTQSKTLASVEESNKKYYRDDRDQICSLIREYAGRIWQQFTNGERLCIDATCNKDENEHAASTAYKQMIADECCAVVSRAFARDVRNIWMNHGAAVPPRSQLELENILRDSILNVLCPDCSKPRAKTRWETVCRDAAIKSSAESYYLTKAVMDEVYRDEDRWCDFESTEENIKETLAEEIFTDQISESFSAMANGSVSTLK